MFITKEQKRNLLRLGFIILFFITWECVLSWYVKNYSESSGIPDPLLIWRPKADFSDSNSIGLREKEISPQKQPGEFRVIILGDSSIYGHDVAQDQTVAKHLETMLRQKYPEKAINVINGGVCGYSSQQGMYFFEDILPVVKPDLVILGYFHSDIKMEQQLDTAIVQKTPLTSMKRLLYKSNLYLLLRKQIGLFRYNLPGGDGRSLQQAGDFNRVPPQDYCQNLRKMSEMSKKAGANVILLKMQPPANGFPRRISNETVKTYLAVIGKVGHEISAPVVDIWSAFVSHDPSEMYCMDKFHPNSFGHRIMAQEILKCVVQQKYLEEQ